MKKLFTCSLLFACFYVSSFAQEKKFEFGLHAGLNLNTVRTDVFPGTQTGSLLGANFGFDLGFKCSEHFGIKAMPQIDQNGWAFRSVYLEGTPPGAPLQKGDILVRLAYLNLPVLAHYSFGEKVKFNAGAGGFAGLLIDNLLVTKPSKNSGPELHKTTSSSDSYKSLNYGLSFSAGVQLPLNKRLKLNLGLLENLGLASINKSGGSIRTNALTTMVGVIFTPQGFVAAK
jgi:hypothetical protein